MTSKKEYWHNKDEFNMTLGIEYITYKLLITKYFSVSSKLIYASNMHKNC